MSGDWPLARINNPITFVDGTVEEHLARYDAAGFVVSDHIADWDPGLRCGFVSLWPEYLELLTVADEAAYAAHADAELRADRTHGAIHAVELYSKDTQRVHDALAGRWDQLPDVETARLATTAPEAPPDFYFLALPALPGTRATTMTSTFADAAMRRFVNLAPNGVFGLAGLTIVVEDPVGARRAWAEVTEPGVHRLELLTPSEWQERGAAPGRDTGVVCLHLVSQDVERTVVAMTGAGWVAGDPIDGRRHLLPHPADGVRFTVEPGDVGDWLRRRREVLGERLSVRTS